MVELFKRSKFFLSVASKMSYDDGIVYTENNIVSYLAELEEHICSLITYSAFKKDDPNAAISAIPLNQLNHKEFGKKELDVSFQSPLIAAVTLDRTSTANKLHRRRLGQELRPIQ